MSKGEGKVTRLPQEVVHIERVTRDKSGIYLLLTLLFRFDLMQSVISNTVPVGVDASNCKITKLKLI